MDHREYFNLEPLGVLAVERTQDCVAALRRQAAEHTQRARRVEQEARQAEEQTLAALSVELGIQLPPQAAFRLVGHVLEVTWTGARSLVFGEEPPAAEEPAAQATPNENQDEAAAEEEPVKEEPETVAA